MYVELWQEKGYVIKPYFTLHELHNSTLPRRRYQQEAVGGEAHDGSSVGQSESAGTSILSIIIIIIVMAVHSFRPLNSSAKAVTFNNASSVCK